MESEELYVQTLEKFGENLVGRDQVQVGSAFLQFSLFTKELMALFKNLVRVEKVPVNFSWMCSIWAHNFLFTDAEHEQHHQLPLGQSAEGGPEGGQRGGCASVSPFLCWSSVDVGDEDDS